MPKKNVQRIPFFPLNLIVFPSEPLNLHVFEPRYRQLVKDCLNLNTPFGIPPHINERTMSYGTLMEIEAVVNKYPDGRMDIKTKGIQTFYMNSFENPMEDKLYAGGSVVEIPMNDNANDAQKWMLVEKVTELFDLMEVNISFDAKTPFLSFKLGHHIGLSVGQEYHLLTIPDEYKRIEYMLDYVERALPIVREIERSKQRIKMNGHFKNIRFRFDE
ncbi:LON peptidase substrate-binding domain-containing protein [Limibacter armeniacum]|uniref:LON peptidase substrate-binding domain-containing protein n=1 Tax=Limibacter armeniacum TaxID=466084 RepID=UPI002FE6C0FD